MPSLTNVQRIVKMASSVSKFSQQSLDNYERRVLALLDKLTRQHLRREISRRLRNPASMSFSNLPLLKTCLMELSGLPANSSKASLLGTKVAILSAGAVRDALQKFVLNNNSIGCEAADRVVRTLLPNAAVLDVRLQLPPVKKSSRKSSVRKTLVEKRAAKVAASLTNWKRKQALAKTKVASLKKRAAYYARKVSDK